MNQISLTFFGTVSIHYQAVQLPSRLQNERPGYDSWCKGLYRVTDVETLMAEWAMISTLSKDNQLNFRKQKELDMIKMDDLDRNLHERYLERQILELEEKLVNQESREDEYVKSLCTSSALASLDERRVQIESPFNRVPLENNPSKA
ncbi:hypothetical protein FRB90_002619 [Tulasnella sp. 427]|nr:hypothetical protein FRB90_002619 [Tulasnella sp. 427]